MAPAASSGTGTPDGATHYLWDSASGINIEKFIGSGGSTQWSNYVFAGGQMVAVFYERTPGPSATRYFHKDHLGSLAVITDEAGRPLRKAMVWLDRRRVEGLPRMGGKWGLAFRALGVTEKMSSFTQRFPKPRAWRTVH